MNCSEWGRLGNWRNQEARHKRRKAEKGEEKEQAQNAEGEAKKVGGKVSEGPPRWRAASGGSGWSLSGRRSPRANEQGENAMGSGVPAMT